MGKATGGLVQHYIGKIWVKVALENAASVSGMLLTTECVITEVKKDEPAMPMGGGIPAMI